MTFLLRKEQNFEKARKGRERRGSLGDIVPTIRLLPLEGRKFLPFSFASLAAYKAVNQHFIIKYL